MTKLVQVVDSRKEVKHSDKNDLLITENVVGRASVTKDEERVMREG